MMKHANRHGGPQAGQGIRRSRSSSNVQLRILIYFKAAGAIIGKGGENIRQFRDMDDIEEITVPDRSSPERIVTICGKTIEAVVECLQAMMDKLDEANEKYMGVEDTEIRMLIHASQVGAVIGRGGQRVKEMKHQKQVEILLLPYNCPLSSERIVLLCGTQENVAQCVGRILSICQETPAKGMYTLYDCVNFDPRFVDDYGGFVELSGTPPRGSPKAMGAHPPLTPTVSDGYGAPPDGIFNKFPLPPPKNKPYRQPPVITADYGPVMLPNGYGVDENQMLQLPVPLKAAEAVIGKGGSRIRWIRGQTGAGIAILPQTDPAGGHRVFQVTGSPPQIQMAQRLIRQSYVKPGPGRNVQK